jgi:topoisomerase IV subunit A
MEEDQLNNGQNNENQGKEPDLHDHVGSVPPEDDLQKVTHLSGMYENWFLDYASYVILERAVPHINDGLKPVQRRIMHSMKRLDDGRYNKVANIIGHTMQFHPHGDASIGDALVQLGQKDLLVDTQGNWGNILTGDGAAAPRYIEARLSKFALDVVFNPKTTSWKQSYDGRNKEPITLPIKFPLLLAQGVEGIAVGLASKIMPHNFNELIDASVAYLQGKDFVLYPDFPSGGMIDVSKYNDGIRGGNVRVRAKINKVDKKTLSITELPFGRTTSTLIESIIKANEKGKIKIRKIDDNTAENVEIIIHLMSGISPDMTIDALYAFSDCEVSISPNSCVIEDDKPIFPGVKNMLKRTADQTKDLLKMELNIRLNELEDDWHQASLEKIFIVNEVYEGIKECKTEDEIYKAIDDGLKPFVKNLRREVVREDLVRLSNIPIKRISKYSSFKADEYIKGLETEMEEVKNHLEHIVDYTIEYYRQIKKKYGKGRERHTEIRNFESIEATHVVADNTKLYVNREEGFIGTSLKKDEFVCDCSDIDDIMTILDDGTYKITKISDKTYVGKNIIYAGVFRKNDERTIYNVIYRDGMNGNIMAKRCAISGLTREKDYNLTKGTNGSKILYLTVNPNGEAEVISVKLKPRPRMRTGKIDFDFSELAIKGKSSMGNILTRYAIHRISLKEQGGSTLGGLKLWFDKTVLRLNSDEYGQYLGEFRSGDKIISFYQSGHYKWSGYDLSLHFDEDIILIEKYNPLKKYTAVFFDADQEFYYLKRFDIEETENLQSFIGENKDSKFIALSGERFPQFKIVFGGKYKDREDEVVDADEFITIKSHKARGKRLTTFTVKEIVEMEPKQEGEWEDENIDTETDENNPSNDDDENGSTQMTLGL